MFSLILVSLMVAQAKPKPELVEPPVPTIKDGYYEVVGDLDGKEYTSIAIIGKQGRNYAVIWINGAEQHVGCGIIEEGRLVVGFGSASGMRGVASYGIGDGKLSGWWTTLPGDGRRQKESLTFLKPLKKEK